MTTTRPITLTQIPIIPPVTSHRTWQRLQCVEFSLSHSTLSGPSAAAIRGTLRSSLTRKCRARATFTTVYRYLCHRRMCSTWPTVTRPRTSSSSSSMRSGPGSGWQGTSSSRSVLIRSWTRPSWCSRRSRARRRPSRRRMRTRSFIDVASLGRMPLLSVVMLTTAATEILNCQMSVWTCVLTLQIHPVFYIKRSQTLL